jgi:hypothetical protein
MRGLVSGLTFDIDWGSISGFLYNTQPSPILRSWNMKYFHHPTKKDGDIGDVAILEDRIILATSKQP